MPPKFINLVVNRCLRDYIFIMKNLLILVVTTVLFLAGCGKGIEPSAPETEMPGFSGKITFKGTWPAGITRTHIVVFKNPLISAADFNAFNIKYVSPAIPYGVNSYNYNSVDSALISIGPGEYNYVAVAQSKTETLSLTRADWTVAGVYYAAGDTSTPGKLLINQNKLTTGIDIICDFDNPPSQPPGGN